MSTVPEHLDWLPCIIIPDIFPVMEMKICGWWHFSHVLAMMNFLSIRQRGWKKKSAVS